MSFILRSSRYLKNIYGLTQNIRIVKKNVCARYVHSTGINLHFTTSAAGKTNDLEQILNNVNYKAEKYGRISRKDIETVINNVKRHGSMSQAQSLMLIRCCGNIALEETASSRMALLQEVWQTLKDLKIPMDINHYNALLRVYIENEHTFSPVEFLTELESKKIEPTQVTYGRLIWRYCQMGEIQGALNILKCMKEKDLPITENDYNALIMGYGQAGELEQAENMIPLMSKIGFIPSEGSYTKLMCAYAKNGDIETIQKTLDDCISNDLAISDQRILEIIYELSINGHANLVDPLFSRLNKSNNYNQLVINTILRLVNKDQVDVAYKVLKTMRRLTRTTGSLVDSGNFLINHLVKANCPLDKIKTICRDLEEDGLNSDTNFVFLKAILVNGRSDLAIPFMRELRDQSIPIQQHYFWPLFCQKKSNEHLIELLEVMQKDFGLTPSVETVRDYVVPNLQGVSPVEAVNLLRFADIAKSTTITCVAYNCLEQNDIKAAAEITRQRNVFIHPKMFRKVLVSALINTRDFENYIQFVRNIYDNYHLFETIRTPKRAEENESESDQPQASQYDETGVLGQIVFDILYNFPDDDCISALTRVLEDLVEQGLSISEEQASRLKHRLDSEITPDILRLLTKLSSGELQPIEGKSLNYFPIRSMKADQIEKVISQTKDLDSSGLKRALLASCCKEKDANKYDEVLSSLEEEETGFQLTGGLYVELMELQANYGDPHKVISTFKRAHKKISGFQLERAKAMFIVSALVKRGLLEDAIKLLELNKISSPCSFSKHHYGYEQQCWTLLNALAADGKTEEVNSVYNCFVNNNYIEENNSMLGSLVKVHIVNNDLQTAVDTFETLCKKFRSTPLKRDLLTALIVAKDEKNLERVLKLSTDIHGRVNTLLDTVFAYLDCGCVQEAENVLKQIDVHRFNRKRWSTQIKHYYDANHVEILENVIIASRFINHIERGEIFYYLMLSYCRQQATDKALDVWVRMQEEDVTPSEAFLSKLGQYLQTKNVEIPFVIPNQKIELRASQKTKQLEAKKVNNFEARKASRNMDQLLAEYRAVLASNKVSVQKFNEIFEELYEADCLQEATNLVFKSLDEYSHPSIYFFKRYLSRVSNSGEVETILRIEKRVSSELHKVLSISNRKCLAYLTSNRTDEFLDQITSSLAMANTEKDISDLRRDLPRGGFLILLQKCPEILVKFEAFAISAAAKSIFEPINMLWCHHFIEGNTEAETKIWNAHIKSQPNILIKYITQAATKNKDTSMITSLIDKLEKSQISKERLGIAYSSLIDLHVANGDLKMASNFIKQLRANNMFEFLLPSSLNNYYSSLKALRGPKLIN